MKIIQTTTGHEDFVLLTAGLDAELNRRYGRGQAMYDTHNKMAAPDLAVVGYVDGAPAACGCFRAMDGQTMEIKRMFVAKEHRCKGYAVLILTALEKTGARQGHVKAVLETGKGQPEAICLYEKCGYAKMDNYGPYKGLDNSVCMEKSLT